VISPFRPLLAGLTGLALCACAHAPALDQAASLPETPLLATDRATYKLSELVSGAPATVVEFFSSDCPCQDAHDERLIALYQRYHAQGVRFVVVDANYGAALDHDLAEVNERHYPFPIFVDPGGAMIKALGAKYATYSVLLDSQGRVRYRGGFDSDRHPLSAHPRAYLDDAIGALLAGRDPNPAETKTQGCALERW
jgi:thiol-disulfide isomerase/thioredoxin